MYDVWTGLTPAQPTGVSLYVRSGSTALNDTFVVLGDDDTTTTDGAIFFYAHESGNLAVATVGHILNLGPYLEDTWYQVDFTVDWACEMFDVSIDGNLKVANVSFRNPGIEHFSQLHLFNYDVSTAWWDQIIFSGPPASTTVFADDFERLSTCRWSATVP
jgi:hypothetical protein